MVKTYFAVSDIHGYYTELVQALEQAGFDQKNGDHILICCGDLFDRGEENLRVYDFVRSLERKVLIRGNHEQMLCEVLGQGRITQREVDNGMDITVRQLLGAGAIDDDGCFDVEAHADRIDEIRAFVDSMADYYELGGYIFTHGWLPIIFEGRYPRVDPAWREATRKVWDRARELQWQQLYAVHAVPDEKILVCGHRPAYLAHVYDSTREPDCSEPFFGEGMIAIDAWTVRSGRVNVLVIEEDQPQ